MPSSVRHVGLNAHLLSGRDTYRSAGIHHYLHNLLSHLPAAASDMRLTIFVGDGDVTIQPEASVKICRSRWPTRRPPVRIAWEQFGLPWVARNVGLDLLHSLAFVSPLAAPCPAVVTVYDLSFLRHPEKFRASNSLYLRIFTRLSCRQARQVMAISRSTRNDVIAAYGLAPARVTVVYPGCEPQFQPLPHAVVEAFRERLGLPGRFVLYLGTLEPRKNVGLLVRAFARARRPGVKLVLAGAPGWHVAETYRAIEEAGLAGDVVMPGYIKAQEKVLWYNAADVFAYPSAYEGFGLPVLEALACGTPVVTSDSAALPEVAGDAACLVPAGDEAALAAALTTLLDDDSRRMALAARGPAQAAKFSWSVAAERVAEVYRRVTPLTACSS